MVMIELIFVKLNYLKFSSNIGGDCRGVRLYYIRMIKENVKI